MERKDIIGSDKDEGAMNLVGSSWLGEAWFVREIFVPLLKHES